MASRRARSEDPGGRNDTESVDRRARMARMGSALRETNAALLEEATEMARNAESKFGDSLVVQMHDHPFEILMGITKAVKSSLPHILSDAGMPAGTTGTVYVTASRDIIVKLEGHVEGLRERALRAVAGQIVQLDAAGVSGHQLEWAFVILAAWGGTYQSVDRDVVNLLRPHLPGHIASTLQASLLWVHWDNSVPYSAERAAEVRSRHGLNVYSYRALDTPSEELKLMEFRRSAWEFEAPRFIRCEHAEEARWIAGAANSVTHTPTRYTSFVDFTGAWRVVRDDSTVAYPDLDSTRVTRDGPMLPEDHLSDLLKAIRYHARSIDAGTTTYTGRLGMDLVNPASFDAAKRRAIAEPLDEKDQACVEITFLLVAKGMYLLGTLDSLRRERTVDEVARVLDVNGVPELVASYAGEQDRWWME